MKLVINISISLGDMIKETSPGEMIRCLPPVTEFLKNFTFCRILCYEVTELNSTKYLICKSFCADANLKYEICISNGFREMAKEVV